MKRIYKNFDIFFYSLLILVCFLLFSHRDIVITGNHSRILLNGNITDFYSACKELTGEYGANYMPSTFILFAIWNLPLRIILGPLQTIESVGLLQIYWYKLLPCLFFFLTAIQLRKLCFRIGFSKEKVRFVCAVFLTAPFAVYSQFLFCQYDIFTVFFMVLGLNEYFEENSSNKNWSFCLFFGLAITFKYQALLFFLVLLFFKEKRITKILPSIGVAVLPIMLETIFYLVFDRDAFSRAVLRFSALNKISSEVKGEAFTTINPFVVFMCLLLALSFYMETKSKEEEICNAFFLCSGVCFGLYGLMAWHPQWLLLGVFFWTVSTCVNKYCDILLLLDSLGILVYYVFICKLFPDNVDQRLLVNGGLFDVLKNKDRNGITMMQEFYHSNVIETSMLFSVLFAIFLVQFIFSYSHFRQKDIFTEIGSRWVLRLRFGVGVLGFVIPALLCLPSMLERPEILYESDQYESVEYVLDFNNRDVKQSISLKECVIEEIQIFTATFNSEVPGTQLRAEIVDTINGRTIGVATISGDEIQNNGYSAFKFDNCVLEDSIYEMRVHCLTSEVDEYTTVYYYTPDAENSNKEYLTIDEMLLGQTSMVIRVLGN